MQSQSVEGAPPAGVRGDPEPPSRGRSSADEPANEPAHGDAMSQYVIAVVIGSLRRDSINRKLANAVARLAPSQFTFKQLRIDDLPLYNQDDDSTPAETVRRLKSEIRSSQALLFVTPEYNRSMPGVLKNAIDHASRPYGQNEWAGKPAGVMGASI